MSVRRRHRVSRLAAAALLWLAPSSLAQTTGNVEGRVDDPSGAGLPGVTVEARSAALQGRRATVTGIDGRFRLPAVPPGVYTVRASLAGFTTAEKIAYVTLDATASVTLALQLSATREVVVSGETPVLDLTSSTTGTTFTAKVLERMALGRNYAEIALSQPGANADSATTLTIANQFNAFSDRVVNVALYGATSLENLYVIDAINTTQVNRGHQGKAINPEAMQEIEIKTGGYQAEYGRALGGVINVVTKSGGNEFHGDVFGHYNARGMRAEAEITADDILASEQTEVLRWDAGADLGGYLLKDRLWFFGSYDRLGQEVTRIPQAGPVAGQRFVVDRSSDIFSAKLTWNPAEGTSVVGSVLGDPDEADGPVGLLSSTNPLTYTGTRRVGGYDYAARLSHLFGSLGLLTLQYSRHGDSYETEIAPEAELPRITDRTVPGVAVTSGGFGNINAFNANYQGRRHAAAGTFAAFTGNHELKAGGDYERASEEGITRRTGGETLNIRPCKANPFSAASVDRCAAVGATGAPYVNWRGDNVPGGVVYTHDYLTNLDGSQALRIPNEVLSLSISAFVQDTWRVSSRLTVNAGLRYDVEQIRNADGATVIDLDGMWSPRAGLVWDARGDGTSKVFGSFGRFYYQFPTNLNFRAFGNDDFIFVSASNYSPSSLVNVRTPFPGSATTPLGNEPTDADLKGMYQDEITLGVEKALTPTFVVGLKANYQSLGDIIEDRCDLDFTAPENHGQACAIFNPGSSEKYARGDFPCNNRFNERPDKALFDPLCNSAGGSPIGSATRIYRGLELTARKSFSERLWTQASYIFSSLRGNYDGASSLVTGQSDPGVNADFDYFQFYQRNATGKLYLDRPHTLQVSATYTAPFGLTAGFSTYVRSGPPIDKAEYFNGGYNQHIFGVERGTAGRAATQYEANLSLAYELRAGPLTISPRLYVFNLLNRQGETRVSNAFNPDGAFDAAGNAIQHVNYRKIVERQQPRLIRLSVRVGF